MIKYYLKKYPLPKYSPKGIKLKWDIEVTKDGTYDPYTGIQDGNYFIEISQRYPGSSYYDDKAIYDLDKNGKLLDTNKRWTNYNYM